MTKDKLNPGPLGHKLRSLRGQAQLSLYELEKRTGINRPNLMRLEDGVIRQPTTETLNKLADVFGVDPEELYDAAWAEQSAPLPSLRTYFRSKFDLPDDQIERLERLMGTLRPESADIDPPQPKQRKERR